MKRLQLCKKGSRSTESSHFNHITRNPSRANVVTPEILVGPIWLQDDEPPSIEIVELHSSEEPPTPDNNGDSLSHAWCYVSDDRSQQLEDCYKINKKAREKRRSIIKNNRLPTNNPDIQEVRDKSNEEVYSDENITLNHQMNYFTIINKHFIDTDTSTDEDYGDIEIATSDDIIGEATDGWNDDQPYDANLDKETRTIWIYSFKNKRLLSENDFEITNIPGIDTSSSTSRSIESEEENSRDNGTNIPIIAPTSHYIPRLNLSIDPALSTVTEVTEPNKQPSSDERRDVVKSKFQKFQNSWVRNDGNSGSGRKSQRSEKSTNIVNWMALSPREKRRRSSGLSDKWKGSILNLSEAESEGRTKISEQKNNETIVIEPVEIKADVHVSASEKTLDKCKVNTSRSTKQDTALKITTDDTNTIEKSKDLDIEEILDQVHGDHDMQWQQKPQIVLSRKSMINAASITDPIEKLNSSNWIYEEKIEKQTGDFDYTIDNCHDVEYDKQTDEHTEINNIWARNARALMKPAQWDEYLPITETPISLHLSLSSIVGEKRRSWFKRLSKCIKCCK